MFAFILRRLAQAIVVMVSVALIAFLLFQYVGDPVVFLLGQDATADQIRELRADLGLDQPFFVQFWHFLANAVQGEFGLSLRQGDNGFLVTCFAGCDPIETVAANVLGTVNVLEAIRQKGKTVRVCQLITSDKCDIRAGKMDMTAPVGPGRRTGRRCRSGAGCRRQGRPGRGPHRAGHAEPLRIPRRGVVQPRGCAPAGRARRCPG